MIATNNKRQKKIKRDNGAGIEGLPLQLMVLVLIAGVGTAVMMGWMSGLSAPSSIGSSAWTLSQMVLQAGGAVGACNGEGVQLTITVLDQNGDAVEGATVVLTI